MIERAGDVMRTKPVDILYVEDDLMDVDLVRNALVSSGHGDVRMQAVEDAEKAIRFLNRSNPYEGVSLPDLILVDLNLPKTHGRELLKTLKQSDRFKRIPVIVFTTSQLQEDIDESYALGASGFVTKPFELKDYQQTFDAICNFWFSRASLPSKNSPSSARGN
jgi:chemotaxis family two-component system response regulator Rcp1